MRVVIKIEAETAGDLTTALYQAIRDIKKEAKKKDGHRTEFKRGFLLEDANCYGDYHLKITAQ